MFKHYLVSYDLKSPIRNYTGLIQAIRELGVNVAHPLESLWIITTSTGDAAWIRNVLRQQMDADDNILVAELSGDWASYLPADQNMWLSQHLGSSMGMPASEILQLLVASK